MRFCFRTYLLCLLFFVQAFIVQGQGIHFSQIDQIPLFLNPALTGNNQEVDFRFGANYRDQESISSTVFKTYNVWSDMAIQPTILGNGWLGVGMLLAQDKVNATLLDKTQVILNTAYHQTLNNDDVLSIGGTFQYTFNKLNTSELVYEDQWNGLIYDRNIPSQDVLFKNTQSYSLGVGIAYLKLWSDGANTTIGASVTNINHPQQSFIDQLGTVKTQINTSATTTPFRYHFYVNNVWQINEQLTNKTNAYFALQGTASETVIGSYFKYATYEGSPVSMLFGLSHRVGASAIFLGGLEIGRAQFMLSYDSNFNTTRSGVFYHSALELSTIIKGNFFSYEKGSYSRNRRIRCQF